MKQFKSSFIVLLSAFYGENVCLLLENLINLSISKVKLFQFEFKFEKITNNWGI